MFAVHAIKKLHLPTSAFLLCLISYFLPEPMLAMAQQPARLEAGQLQGVQALSTSQSAKSPMMRYVRTEQAEVFAGPGDDFYPTSILKQGEAVEVFQQSIDGWMAISPPTGSFSWLPAAQGLLLPGGRVVEVTEKSAVSWIGSALGTAKQYRWQVKLPRGQQLAVIGEQSLTDPETKTKTLWYKIAPPAGEYRWIQAKATTDIGPDSSLQANSRSNANSAGLQTPSEVGAEPGDQAEASANRVVQASAVGNVRGGNAPGRSSKQAAGRSGPQRGNSTQTQAAQIQAGEDRWANWHAMEFKNGSFSFPGVARMLGMEPATPVAASRSTFDPFDLTANHSTTRAQSMQSANGNALDPNANQDYGATEGIPTTDAGSSPQLASRQARGWRDPKQLRASRSQEDRQLLERDPSSANAASAGQLASDDSLRDDSLRGSSRDADLREDPDGNVMNAGYEEDGAVGTSVVTASGRSPAADSRFNSAGLASHSRRDAQSNGANAESWFGIHQAPNAKSYQPIELSNAGLGDVQLQLTEMVAGPEQFWNLAPLAERTRYYIEHGQSSIERGEARLLLERIDAFAELAKRSNALGLSAAPASRLSTLGVNQASAAAATSTTGWISALANTPSSSQLANSPSATNSAGSDFDATGWLVPVHTSGRDMPTHALTNDSGKIIVYVTAAPGVNLVRFQSQPIGVFGLRGYLPQLKTNHIQVQRVVRLQ